MKSPTSTTLKIAHQHQNIKFDHLIWCKYHKQILTLNSPPKWLFSGVEHITETGLTVKKSRPLSHWVGEGDYTEAITSSDNSQIIKWLVNCNECGKTTQCLKTHKWSDDISHLQWMWKDNALFENSQVIGWYESFTINVDRFLDNALFENSQVIGWYESFAINVERFLGQRTVWKLTSDRMILVICN